MRKRYLALFALSILAILIVASSSFDKEEVPPVSLPKIKGVNFVAPVNPLSAQQLQPLNRINAQWVAVIPYAYTRNGDSKVIFFRKHPHWWGEGVEGAIETIQLSKAAGLKVMLKPQVWVINQGWPGDFEPANEESWKIWEKDYSNYVLTYARICDSLDVDLFCIATEYRKAVVQRPDYWVKLIQKVRRIYSGPITYAANWDNYMNVPFWNLLDYIGVDAYFPLSEQKTPGVNELMLSWQKELQNLERFSRENQRKVLFTEYGYRSCDYAAHKQWESHDGKSVNLPAQENSYRALYTSVWRKEWMAGGFLWKWFADDSKAGGPQNWDFTPQNKPAEKVIREWYGMTE